MSDDRVTAAVDPVTERRLERLGLTGQRQRLDRPLPPLRTAGRPEMARPRQRFEAVARAIRDLLAHRWVKTRQVARARQPQADLLPVDGVPHRPDADQQHHQPAGRADRAGGIAARGARLPPAGRAGARRRPGQRRPGPAGGLLHRLAGHAAILRRRLRPALRVRHLQADHCRTATRSSTPTTGCAGPTPGKWPGPARTIKVPLHATVQMQRRPD